MSTYLLSIDKVPRKNTGFETVEHSGAGGVGLGPAYTKHTDGLCEVVGKAELLKSPLVQFDGVDVQDGGLIPYKSVNGSDHCGLVGD